MTIGKRVSRALEGEFVKAKATARLSTGEILRILREKSELSQKALAERSGLTQATISSLENDRINLGVERARAIAKVLRVHPGVLLFPDWQQAEAG